MPDHIEFFDDEIKVTLSKLPVYEHSDLCTAHLLFLRNRPRKPKFQPQWLGPFPVLERDTTIVTLKIGQTATKHS